MGSICEPLHSMSATCSSSNVHCCFCQLICEPEMLRLFLQRCTLLALRGIFLRNVSRDVFQVRIEACSTSQSTSASSVDADQSDTGDRDVRHASHNSICITLCRKLLPRKETTCHVPRTGKEGLMDMFHPPQSRISGCAETRPTHHFVVRRTTHVSL